MDSPTAGERGVAPSPRDPSDQAIDFVRFCHRRRRVGWPELYDEMCAVAGRGLYRGYGADDLSSIGIGLGLFQMPALAGLVAQVVAEDIERRHRAAAAAAQAHALRDEPECEAAAVAIDPPVAASPALPSHRHEAEPVDPRRSDLRPIRMAVPAGA